MDFWDIKSVLDSCPGYTLLAQGQGSTCEVAFRDAFACFSKAGVDSMEAQGLIIGVAAGQLPEPNAVSSGFFIVQEATSGDANIIFGLVEDRLLGKDVRVSLFAFGFSSRPVTSS